MVSVFKDIKNLFNEKSPEWADDFMVYFKAAWGGILHNQSFDGDMVDLMKRMYDPKKNGFKVVKSGDKIDTNNEVWMSGECLFVNVDEVGLIKEKI